MGGSPFESTQGQPDLAGCVRHLRSLLERWGDGIVNGPGVAIPDTDEDLNWHAFLGHHQDMQGFEAGKFAGADPYTGRGEFRSLRARGIGVRDLASLWGVPAIRDKLLSRQTGSEALARCVGVLRDAGGQVGRELADAWDSFRSRKTKGALRAYLENSHFLGTFGFSFREYLRAQTHQFSPAMDFPPSDVSPAYEGFLVQRIARDFWGVAETMASYMICDWLLWLWREKRIPWFETFKPDSRHEAFAERFGWPFLGRDSFVRFCREQDLGYPPRVVNEVMWLEGEDNRPMNDRVGTGGRELPVQEGEPTMATGDVLKFRSDDEGFLEWFKDHPNGFYINCDHQPHAGYLKLHRVSCGHLKARIAKGDACTVAFMKACSDSRQALSEWALREANGSPDPCAACHP